MKYRNKTVVIEAITFGEFVEYGKKHADSIVDGVPWHFDYNGNPVTHENNDCYLIITSKGNLPFTKEEMLITDERGELCTIEKDIFEKIYELDE